MYFHLPVALITKQFIMNDLSASWWVYGTVRPLNRIFCPGVYHLLENIEIGVPVFGVFFFLVQCTYSEETAFGFFLCVLFCILRWGYAKASFVSINIFHFCIPFLFPYSALPSLLWIFHIIPLYFFPFIFMFLSRSLPPSLSLSVSVCLSLSLSLTGFLLCKEFF